MRSAPRFTGLRAKQDAKTGAYGDVQITCMVLTAFVESPWKYGYEDGPFISRAIDHLLSLQRPDGAICEPDADRLRQRVQTGACIDLFELIIDTPGVKKAMKGCNRFVTRPTTNSSWEETFGEQSDKAILTMAENTLATRKAEGWWEHPFSRVRGTAVNTGRLCGYHLILDGRNIPLMSTPTPLPKFTSADRTKANDTLRRGGAFLLGEAQDGLWGFQGPDPGISAMVLGALLTMPKPRSAATRAAIEKGLDWLVTMQKEDGSIHAGQLANYVTSSAVLALARGGRDKDKPVIAKARAFLVELQADEGDDYQPSDRYYGGIGYGGDEKPDLSNLQMALEALNAAGAEPGDPTMTKALSFLERCQNRSESNDLKLVRGEVTTKSGDDGGAGYAPGESKAGFVELPDGTQVPRSYGSMTYALLKGYLFAGLKNDDPRVVAAWNWLSKNYTLEVNPGFEASGDPTAAYQGLFYYFYTMARALDLYGSDEIKDAAGDSHAWRGELVGRISAMQRQDGSWVNENAERWYEGNPVLATAYAMLTVDAAMPATAKAQETVEETVEKD